MKTLATACLTVFGGLLFIVSHRVIAQRIAAQRIAAQMERVKQDETLVSAPMSAAPFIGEQAIRTLVEGQNRGLRALRASATPVPESAPEQPARHERIVRLVVAQSGELACEYGDYVSAATPPDVNAQSAGGSYLRVWRKQNDQWLVDAVFNRP